MKEKKIILIAGEPSGDAIAASVIKNLPSSANISGVGGIKMSELGFKTIFDIKDISVMGFTEILPKIFIILKRINQTVDYIKEKNPDVVATFDSPGFAKAVVKKLRKKNYKGKIIHIVAPTVWAWKEKRAKKFAEYFNEICCFFPFELKYFEKYGLKSHFVGNPSIEDRFEEIFNYKSEKKNNNFKISKIAITLGSREMEIRRHIKIISNFMNKYSESNPDVEYIFPTLPHLSEFIDKYLKIHNKKNKYILLYTKDAMMEAQNLCDIAITKSGTNTIQFLSYFKPIIVYYKISILSYFIVKSMVKIKFANLVNIIANRMIIPELLQNDFNIENLLNQVKNFSEEQFEDRKIEIIEALKLMFNKNKKPSKLIADVLINEA